MPTQDSSNIVLDYLRENMPAKFKREQKSAGVLPRTASVSRACDGTDPPGGIKQEELEFLASGRE